MSDKKQELSDPRAIRLQVGTERELMILAVENAMEFSTACRMAIKFGLPILKEKLASETVTEE